MEVFIPKEIHPRETRAAIIPAGVKKLIGLDFKVSVEAGLGVASNYLDTEYQEAGAEIVTDRNAALQKADIVLRVRKPEINEVILQKYDSWHVSFLDPFNEKELITAMAKAHLNAISVEMMPRTTIAQKMDALSSQANLAGYFSVITATSEINKIIPMMMTPAGTISPSRVFVIGVGVAGLQAIATAKRMGARVDAFDTRPVVEEQVKSLGAKFVKIDLGETGQTEQGYAKALTPEQIEKQQRGMAKVCAQSDIVITTAKLFGRPAPRIVTGPMVAGMKSGSVIVDLAVESGGNVEGSVPNEIVTTENGVKIIGISNMEGRVPHHASQVYSSNLVNLLEHFQDKESKTILVDLEEEHLKGCLITHGGEIIHEMFK